MSAVAIITARGGSKRIPRKNIREFAGRPILAYPVDAALKSGVFDEVMVSTDDDEIAQVARRLGAEVPFRRSVATSNDFSSTAEVLIEVMGEYARRGRHFDQLCGIYPTAPFVTAERLREAAQKLFESGAHGVVPVASYSVPIWWAMRREDDGRLDFYWPENELKRSQDLPKAYYDTGQFYFLDAERFMAEGRVFAAGTVGIEVSEAELQDIDTEDDWQMAELKFRMLAERRVRARA